MSNLIESGPSAGSAAPDGGERVEPARRGAGAPGGAPTVSIGLPVHNGERYLERAIRSILDQDFTDLELIVVDNASTDATGEIARRYAAADPRVRYHRNPENVGAARNFALALELARGRYFKWAAYDDWLEPSFLRRCVEVLEREPDVTLVFPSTNVWDESGNLVRRYRHPSDIMSRRPERRFFHALWNWKYQTGIFGVMRTDALRATRPMKAYKGSDRVLFAEMVLAGGVRELDEYLFNSTEAVSVRKGRGHDWWTGRPAARPTFDRWRLLGNYLALVARAPQFGPLDRVRMGGAVLLFFCRSWPRRALYDELVAGARYAWRRLAPAPAAAGTAR